MAHHQEFNAYLKQGNFKEFMQAWKIQFEKYGTLGGVALIHLNDKNREDIENLIGINTKNKPHLKLSWQKFKRILLKTRFEDVDFVKVLELYFDKELIPKTTQQERNRDQADAFFEKLLEEDLSDLSKSWIEEEFKTKASVYQVVLKNKDKEKELFDNFIIITQALDNLPITHNTQTSMAVFAAQITGDPHAFDQGGRLHFLLIQAIGHTLGATEHPPKYDDASQKLIRVGLFKEDINNFCSVYGLSAIKNGQHHLGWEGFYTQKEAWNVNLSNVLNVDEIDPKNTRKLYIVENPSIFEILVDKVLQLNLPVGLICSNGQPTQVIYALLDKIEQQNIPMFYAGDFDPEGLLMAQRLLDQYETLDLWLYGEEDYLAQMSVKFVSGRRLKMLASLKDARLIKLAQNIEAHGVGYQENMLDRYLNAIQEEFE